ncbi:MAG TPA: beta-ketoacyl synthase N-terminal-like domain-containing protein, partial [Anaerolineae bacterium]|nr:beta-ketoacyl synthase N-terminal-like domain-containing protein [Anaerolineae bacterium]
MFMNGNGNRRRVVVTGMGVVSPLGNNLNSTWAAMMQGECAVERITKFNTAGFPCTMAAFVKDFDPTNYMDKRDARRMAPFLHFAVAAAQEAIANAGLDLSQEDPTRVGVEIGSAIGGADVVEEERLTLEREGVKKVNP